MKGVSQNSIDMAERDILLVKKEALFLIEIIGDKIIFLENPNGQIDVLAIIGPVENFAIANNFVKKQNFSKGVLFELGIKRAKPYKKSEPLSSHSGKSLFFPKRRQWFKLSERQFLKVAPIIFDFMQSFTNMEVKKWKSNPLTNPFLIKTIKDYYSRKRGFEFYDKRYAPIRGKRFSIALKDDYFINCIYQAEMKCRQNELFGFAKFIDLALSKRGEKRKLYKKLSPADFIEMQGGQNFFAIKEIIARKNLPDYLCEELFDKHLPNGKDNILYNEIKHLFGINGEKSFGRLAVELTIMPQNCPVLSLKITAGKRPNKDHIVFEVFPTFSNFGASSADLEEVVEEFEEVPF